MASEQHIRNYSAADFEAYHIGQLSPAEMHALEKAAMEDPFLGEAFEGYQASRHNMQADLTELSARLQQRTATTKIVSVTATRFALWARIAAMVIVVAGAGLLIYQYASTRQASSPLAKQDNARTAAPILDTTIANEKTVVAPVTDSLRSALPSKPDANNLSTDELSLQQQPSRQTGLPVSSDTVSLAKDASESGRDLALKESPANVVPDQRAALPPAMNPAAKTSNTADKKGTGVFAENDKAYTADNNSMTMTKGKQQNYSAFKTNIFRGKVTDEANNPLPFVNITNPLDNVGTYSDARGYFAITYPDSTLEVQVRSLGFMNKNTRLVNTPTDNQIVLQDDRSTLNEVVVSNKKVNSKRRESNMVLEEPVPVDGWNNYDTYLANNLNVPETFVTKQTGGGEVELSFEVNKQGEPVNIKIERSLCETCDKEAIRLVKDGPKWKRKAKKGRTSVTIAF